MQHPMKSVFKPTISVIRWASCFVLVATLAACGGGGGDSGSGSNPITDPVNNANAVNDTFPAIQSATGGSSTAVQLNDTVTINNTTTAAVLGTNASIAAVTRTSAAPAAGSISFNTSTGVITVAAGTSAGPYAFSYQLCRIASNNTLCDVATASGTVTTTPPASDVAARADILACPSSSFLISSANWSGCLAGKRLVGNDTIVAAQTCELRFLANGSVEYTHNEVTYLPSVVGPADGGLYQNTTREASVQILLGILDWNLVGAATRNRLTKIDLTVDLRGSDTVAVTYFDTALNRRTLNCSLNNI
jgi:hypothetical protein